MKKKLLLANLFAVSMVFAQNAGDTITLDLTQPTNPETFTFNNNKAWTETYNDSNVYTYWTSQVFMFSHIIDGNSWGGSYYDGFTVSKNADDSRQTDIINHQWGCMAQGAIATENATHQITVTAENPYIIAYYSTYSILPSLNVKFTDDNQYEAIGVYIANHPNLYYNQIDNLKKNGNKITLTAHGVKEDSTETTVDFILAEYKQDSLYMSKNWEWFDLSSLGKVKNIYFTMDSWDVGEWGINTPTYFCMDKLKVRVLQPNALQTVENTTLKVCLHSDYIEVIGATAPIEIYTLQGVRVLTSVEPHIATVTLPSGIYMVKCGTQCTKIIR